MGRPIRIGTWRCRAYTRRRFVALLIILASGLADWNGAEAVSQAEPALESSGGPPSPSLDSRLDAESFVEVEEDKDDKMRRISKTLQAGDVVEEAHVSSS